MKKYNISITANTDLSNVIHLREILNNCHAEYTHEATYYFGKTCIINYTAILDDATAMLIKLLGVEILLYEPI